ncbi:MAG: NOP5/NOP56 family protein [archaeon]|nr:NOP5/NOP56 family protein [archaeon]
MQSQDLRKKLMEKTRQKISSEYGAREYHIIKAVNLIEDIDESFNTLVEQIREWYAIHFPELNYFIKDHDQFLELMKLGERKNFSKQKIEKITKDSVIAEKIMQKASNSMGASIAANDFKIILSLGETASILKKQRKELEKYISQEISALSPNFAKLAEPLIAAKMLSIAGNYKRLAFFPSSSIQLIGAKTAMFNHLSKGAKTPKHGILFGHALVRGVKKQDKGKVARSLAGKLSIALKQDFFGKKDITKELSKQLNQRMEQIKKD